MWIESCFVVFNSFFEFVNFFFFISFKVVVENFVISDLVNGDKFILEVFTVDMV